MSAAVVVERLGIHFFFDRQNRVVTPALARIRRRGSDAWGIRDVSFSATGGEGVALVGASGAGKTTLMRTIAGVFAPDAGRVEVRGRIASLLSIDAGLMESLTGKENCALVGVLAGLSRRRARRSLAEVKARTELGAAFDHPVSSYSQGMRARLGFAIAELVEPEILLLDEVHEALDHEFRTLVEERAHAILRHGGIVIAAGHDHSLLARLCGRALLLSGSTVAADGDFERVLQEYLT